MRIRTEYFSEDNALLILNLKLIKKGFRFKLTDQRVDFFEKCKLIFDLVSNHTLD